jgi:hypothetical protein
MYEFRRLKPGIDCVRLPRKFDIMLPRAAEPGRPRTKLASVEPHRSTSSSRGIGISACCALSVEIVLWSSGISLREEQHRSTAAALRRWTRTRLITHKQTNKFAAHEQLRAASAQSTPVFSRATLGEYAYIEYRVGLSMFDVALVDG